MADLERTTEAMNSALRVLEGISLIDGPYADWEQDRLDAIADLEDALEHIEEEK